MREHEDIKSFDDLCENYSTWIIKYCSSTFDSSIFLVWYTDTDDKNSDRLLTYKDGEIFAVNSLAHLKATVLASIEKLVVSENIGPWLFNFNNLDVKEYCTYDLTSIENAINRNDLDISTIEDFANFVNLFGDFVEQDERNVHLKIYSQNELMRKVWSYFYDFIFWPRFNDKEKFEKWDRPPLVIDTNELSLKLKDIVKKFDENIRLT